MSGHFLAICGGVGGAKLAHGLAATLAPEDLTLVVNTGDDFTHLGLHISPDIDTVIYTLAGLADRERGWGIAGESWNFMASLGRLNGENWFQLGDQDLAMHVERTRRLVEGQSLSEVTRALSAALGLPNFIVPMSDDPVRTFVRTVDGELAFQRYFVREQCRPVATGIRFSGANSACISRGFDTALSRADLAAVIICPSNPYLSVDPVLALPGVRQRLIELNVPLVAVSPIVGGEALKGPAAKLMRELGSSPSALGIALHYEGLIDGLLIDDVDAGEIDSISRLLISVQTCASVMKDDADRRALAEATLEFAMRIAK